ncbi:hypothetical protein JCM5353_005247 [Sporobolomyces roseus]
MAFQTEFPYVKEAFTDRDLKVSTLAFGFVIGFVIPCINTAYSQTHKLSAYTVMIWSSLLYVALISPKELVDIDIFSHSDLLAVSYRRHTTLVFVLLLNLDVLGTSSPILARELNLTHALSIKANHASSTLPAMFSKSLSSRVNLLWSDRRNQAYLKYGVAALITLINISVYCIWIPARLQINHRYEVINAIWDRVEKCIYLVVDAALNYLFMHTVNQRLVNQGLERYRPLVKFNRNLIWISMGCDVMIIGLMSLPNSFVYMAFHPVAYLIKLAIEMALGDLIVTISSAKPARSALDAGFEGLKIAVSTHTTTTAVRFDDEDDNEKPDPMRKTRTPARPDLGIRLEKMRKDRRARKENKDLHETDTQFEDDVKIDMEEMNETGNWESSIHHLPSHGTYSPASLDDDKV